MLESEGIDLQDCIWVAKLPATNFGTFTLSVADAWPTVTDACCLVCSCEALCASKVGRSDLWSFLKVGCEKKSPCCSSVISITCGTPLGSSRGLNFSPHFVYVMYVFQLLLQVITKQIVSKRNLLGAQWGIVFPNIGFHELPPLHVEFVVDMH